MTYRDISYVDLTNDIRTYIDHVNYHSDDTDPDYQEQLADERRYIHHSLRLFRNHASLDDHNTSLIMLAIVRNRIYRYVAMALQAGADFNITEAARLLNFIEHYAHTTQVKISIAQKA